MPDPLPLQPRVVLRQRPPVGLDAELVVAGRSAAMIASFSGAGEPPSPVISVVIPWKIFDGRLGFTRMVISDCPSMSMNPGATTLPAASTVRFALRPLKPPDRRDPPIADAEVARVPRRAGAVDDAAVPDEEVEGGRLSGKRTER